MRNSSILNKRFLMKKLFITESKYLTSDLALLVARVALSLLMLSHGIPKMQALFSGEPIQFPGVLGLSAKLSLAMAVFAEVVCPLFILAGLGTRVATLPLIATMAIAAFSIHAADVFAKKELALLYLSGYIVLFVAGSGKYSMDYFLQPRNVRQKAKLV